MKKITLFAISCFCIVSSLFAQLDVTLPSLRRVYQSTYMNPAFMPKYKTSIGIPILSNLQFDITRTGFTLNDLFETVDEQGLVDLNQFYEKIEGEGIAIQTTLNTDIFHVSFNIKGFQIGINSSLKTQNNQLFGKDFIGFVANGNDFYRGKTAQVEPLRLYSLQYIENGLSISKQIRKFSVGVRGKYLQGIATTRTQNLRFSFFTPTSQFDPLVINTNGSFQTAGIPLLLDSVTGQPKNDKDKEFDPANLYNFANNGFAFDAGFTYQVLPKLLVHASVVDFGSITWRENTYNYELQGKDVSFGGLSYEQLNSPGLRKNFTDSLTKLLIDSKITTNSFKTKLQARYFIGLDFDLTKRDRFGALFQSRNFGDITTTAYTFSYTRKMTTNWDLTANYTLYSNIPSGVGIGSARKMGPVQLYFIMDDILILFNPNTANKIYFRFGLNLVFSDLLKP